MTANRRSWKQTFAAHPGPTSCHWHSYLRKRIGSSEKCAFLTRTSIRRRTRTAQMSSRLIGDFSRRDGWGQMGSCSICGAWPRALGASAHRRQRPGPPGRGPRRFGPDGLGCGSDRADTRRRGLRIRAAPGNSRPRAIGFSMKTGDVTIAIQMNDKTLPHLQERRIARPWEMRGRALR